MKGLTLKQRDVLQFIQHYVTTNRYSPSYREIQAHFGFESLSSVAKYIEVLKRKGFLTIEKHCGRSLALTESISEHRTFGNLFAVPFIGLISGGGSIELFANNETISIPSEYVQTPENTYCLRVKGDALHEELMVEGDLLIIEARPIAHPGEVIVGLINEHDTIVKRYYPEGFYVRLVAAVPHVHPMIVRADDLRIQGIVTALIRRF